MKSIFLFFTLCFSLAFVLKDDAPIKEEITIELINAESLDFEFSVHYQEVRKQIHVRSDKPVKSLRLVNDSKTVKSYPIMGSNLVLLPLVDFTAGQSHFVEVKFIKADQVVLAKINVPEAYQTTIN